MLTVAPLTHSCSYTSVLQCLRRQPFHVPAPEVGACARNRQCDVSQSWSLACFLQSGILLEKGSERPAASPGHQHRWDAHFPGELEMGTPHKDESSPLHRPAIADRTCEGRLICKATHHNQAHAFAAYPVVMHGRTSQGMLHS